MGRRGLLTSAQSMLGAEKTRLSYMKWHQIHQDPTNTWKFPGKADVRVLETASSDPAQPSEDSEDCFDPNADPVGPDFTRNTWIITQM